MQNLTHIRLDNNRITEKGADAILGSLNYNIKLLNLSNNNIGHLGCKHLSQFLQDKHNK